MKASLKNTIYPLISVVAFVGVWWIASAIVGAEILLPTPARTVEVFFLTLGEASFWLSLTMTVVRSIVGFAISFILAVLFAALGSVVKPVHKLLYPLVAVLRAIPTMSVILLVLIWLRSKYSPLLIAFLVIFPMLYTTVHDSIEGVDCELLEMCEVYGITKADRLRYFMIPAVSSLIFSQTVSCLTLNVKLTIAAEALAQTATSIGNLMQSAKANFDTPILLAYTLAAVVVCLIIEGVLRLIAKLCKRSAKGGRGIC